MVMVGGWIAAVGVYDFPHCDSFGDVPRARAASYFKMAGNSRIVKLISMKEGIWCVGLSLGFHGPGRLADVLRLSSFGPVAAEAASSSCT